MDYLKSLPLSLKERMGEMDEMGVEEKCQLIVEAIREKKGHQIVSINLTEVDHSICDAFIICHGESSTQVSAITDNIQKKLKVDNGIRAHHVEGLQNSQWVLMDYFDVLVHIFQEEYRSFYRLEELWADGKVVMMKEES